MSGAAAVRAASEPAQHAPTLLLNPRSFSVSRQDIAARAEALARSYGVAVMRVTDAAEMHHAIERLRGQGQRVVYVLAGDGTVQALAESLVSLSDDRQRPQLLVLGGGRSNLTARDLLHARGPVLGTLEAALRRWREGTPLVVEHRHVLRIEQPTRPARHGFFLAAGWADCAIRACHRHRDEGTGRWRESNAGTLWALAKLFAPAMLGVREPALDRLQVEAPEVERLPGPARLLVATTLHHRSGLLDPYAQRGEGAVRFTAIAARGIRLWLRLPRVLSGRFTPGMNAPNGYLSGRCDALRVTGMSGYTLDGEELEADPACPVTIRTGPRLAFLTL